MVLAHGKIGGGRGIERLVEEGGVGTGKHSSALRARVRANPAWCNRRVGGFCSCVSYQLVHLEVCEVEFGTISPHFISTCNSASVEVILYL